MPSSLRRASLLVCACALASVAACADDAGFAVDTRILFDDTVDELTLVNVKALVLSATGDEIFTQRINLDRPLRRDERFRYRPLDRTRTLVLAVDALAAGDTPLAHGDSGALMLEPGKTIQADILVAATGGGGDLGTDLAPGPDLGTLPPSRCDQLVPADESIFCVGFENPSDATELGSKNNGVTALDPSHAYRGASSLKLSTVSGFANMLKSAEAIKGGLPEKPMYATRGFYYMDAPPPKATRFIDIQQGASPYSELILTIDPMARVGAVALTSNADYAKQSATPFPIGRWVCVEMRITWGGAGTGRIQWLLDDVELTDITFNGDTQDMPRLDTAIYGQYWSQGPAAPWDVWIDEIMVAAQPIGCAK